ncbi:D-2-hydroxyglutarate dehydrogenase YdiJ [Sessilibacter corallicola]|uniref:D-2-hydroxyglutarate dehydrogenase YdiJ n=1 Tax=Sessilibacter corallicola TaxID=2904075 RepID=UPI001E441061|nr:FAD-binding and (Fe-S)-binding domain-containing protein [Sessilibacter corallicola]MCE2028762.1 FAD-binding oxidoreductase [Sessilibacter corallicola]
MIPAISQTSPVQGLYLSFIDTLKSCGFEGDLSPDYANRTVLATDNSIYQVLPQGVLYPKNIDDLVKIAEVSNMRQFQGVVLSPRGGGTGTNGQSLTDGLIVDISKHMNQILEINVEEGWARVQTGVVKDQLNAAAKEHGLFFAPELSTSNRATIGGMINTDASGQGSCVYGKTRDHVLELKTVLLDGTEWVSHAMSDTELEAVKNQPNRAGQIHRVIDDINNNYRDEIEAKFPKLNRCLTGYDLAHIRDDNGNFNLNNILCGSEGTLGFIAEAKINLLKIPKYTALVNLRYSNFDACLRHASRLMAAGPTSIETVDSKVMSLAQSDIIWNTVGHFFDDDSDNELAAINLVEYTNDDEEQLKSDIKRLTDQLEGTDASNPSYGYSIAYGADVGKIWAMRKKSVGLLGKSKGEARPIPFVEDTAVPPENLADYIQEFRALLDENNLKYGMFGHVDAGVLHVRPAVDMKDPDQEPMIRDITDKVVELTDKYNGLVWGEHGKGFRSEYATTFFGDLYPQLQRIKAEFDPRNQLNPGKIATPNSGIPLIKVDEVVTRGQEDRKIPVKSWQAYQEAVYCNGNGACYNYNPNDAMCPSWKATRERIHSPKGRSSLIREWLKQLAERNIDPQVESEKAKQKSFLVSLLPRIQNTVKKQKGEYDFNHEIHTAMMGCLACKSCVGQCPINVDVPEFRSKFLELYYARYLRPLKDYFIGGLEFTIPYLAKAPWLYNAPLSLNPVKKLFAQYAGMVDSPKLSGIHLDQALAEIGVLYAVPENIATLDAEQKNTSVIIVQDAFTSFFETQFLLDALKLLKALGFNPMLAPYKANGKPLHVHGFLKQFKNVASKTADFLNGLNYSEIPLVGLEPSMTLAYRSEYKKVLGEDAPKVQLIQEWLAEQDLSDKADNFSGESFTLFGHCTEKTNAAASMKDWSKIFSDLNLAYKEESVGCCGMAGTYGHETQNVDNSKAIYALSWEPKIDQLNDTTQVMATGYSCRCQTKRLSDVEVPHPLQALLKAYQQ